MKQRSIRDCKTVSNFIIPLFTLILILLFHFTRTNAARNLLSSHDQAVLADDEDVKATQKIHIHLGANANTKNENDLYNLMGFEENCEDVDDEECLRRRMTAEAHLDYIYTQRQAHRHKDKNNTTSTPPGLNTP